MSIPFVIRAAVHRIRAQRTAGGQAMKCMQCAILTPITRRHNACALNRRSFTASQRSGGWAIILFKDGRQNQKKREQANHINPTTCLVAMRRKEQADSVASFHEKGNPKRQKQRIARVPPESQKENAGGKRGCRDNP